ncbi:MAG: hypothetical protein ABTQ34_00210 [Bdellovibrionales bacterium]
MNDTTKKPAPPTQSKKPRAPYPKAKTASEDASRLLSPKAFWAIVIVGIGLIAWMITAAPKQKKLVCTSSPNHSLLDIGRCKEE